MLCIYARQMDKSIKSATWMLIFYFVKCPKHLASVIYIWIVYIIKTFLEFRSDMS